MIITTMSRTVYSPEFKAKTVIEVLEGARDLEAIAADNQLNPNMVRKWKSVFLQNAGKAFEQLDKGTKEARRKERKREKENERLLRASGLDKRAIISIQCAHTNPVQ